LGPVAVRYVPSALTDSYSDRLSHISAYRLESFRRRVFDQDPRSEGVAGEVHLADLDVGPGKEVIDHAVQFLLRTRRKRFDLHYSARSCCSCCRSRCWFPLGRRGWFGVEWFSVRWHSRRRLAVVVQVGESHGQACGDGQGGMILKLQMQVRFRGGARVPAVAELLSGLDRFARAHTE